MPRGRSPKQSLLHAHVPADDAQPYVGVFYVKPNDYCLNSLENVVTLRPGTVAKNVELVVGVMADIGFQ
jgi:hypothetical protein